MRRACTCDAHDYGIKLHVASCLQHPQHSTSIMARFCAADNYLSHEGFAHFPSIGDSIQGIPQVKDGSCVSGISPQGASQLEEGDLVTGTIDIAHEHAHMLSVSQHEDCTEEKKQMVCAYSPLTTQSNSSVSIRRII